MNDDAYYNTGRKVLRYIRRVPVGEEVRLPIIVNLTPIQAVTYHADLAALLRDKNHSYITLYDFDRLYMDEFTDKNIRQMLKLLVDAKTHSVRFDLRGLLEDGIILFYAKLQDQVNSGGGFPKFTCITDIRDPLSPEHDWPKKFAALTSCDYSLRERSGKMNPHTLFMGFEDIFGDLDQLAAAGGKNASPTLPAGSCK